MNELDVLNIGIALFLQTILGQLCFAPVGFTIGYIFFRIVEANR